MSWFVNQGIRLLFCGLLIAAVFSEPVLAQDKEHSSKKDLTVACDLGFAPFCFKNLSGKITGFTYDFSLAIAKSLGRPGLHVIDTNYSTIFAGLFAKRYELIAAPTNITKNRASEMLFSEPYMPTGIGFLTKSGHKIKSLKDLKGKVMTVNNGSVSDKWLTDHKSKYGYSVQRFNKNADAVQAVMIGRGYANVADVPVSRYIAKKNPMAQVAFIVHDGNNFGLAFRKNDKAFRARVEKVIECMKKSGALASIYKKWFGKPAPNSSVVKISPGIGAPGFAGYDSNKHKLSCNP